VQPAHLITDIDARRLAREFEQAVSHALPNHGISA